MVVITQAMDSRLMGSCSMPSLKGPGSKLLCFHTRITMGMPSAQAAHPRHVLLIYEHVYSSVSARGTAHHFVKSLRR